MSLRTRLSKLETALAPAGGICRHAAVIRIVGDVTDEVRRRNETPEICSECGLPPAARINIIRLPARMTEAEWEAEQAKKKAAKKR